MARNDQFSKDPKLPQFQPDPLAWLNELQIRLYVLYLQLISSMNLLIQGYQYVSTTLTGSTFGPTATTRGRVMVVNGAGAVPDRIYLCNWDGTGYVWSKFALYESTTAAWTPGAVNNGASVSLTVSVPNVSSAAQMAMAAFVGPLPAGCVLMATVIATGSVNTVNVVLYNLSGANQNIAAGTLTVYLLQ